MWKPSPILKGWLTIRTDLPQTFRDDIAAFQPALPAAYPAIYDDIERCGGKGYRKVTHADFQIFIDPRKAEAAERHRR